MEVFDFEGIKGVSVCSTGSGLTWPCERSSDALSFRAHTRSRRTVAILAVFSFALIYSELQTQTSAL